MSVNKIQQVELEEKRKKRKSSKFVLASLEKRAQQLETMLKLTKPISNFVKRVEFLESKLNEKDMISPPSSTTVKSGTDNEETIFKLPKEALEDDSFITSLAKTFINTSTHSILFNGENHIVKEMKDNIFLKLVLFTTTVCNLKDNKGYNLNQVEDYCDNIVKSYLPEVYVTPTISNMHGLMLYGFYFFKLRKFYSAEKYIDHSFKMFQSISCGNGLIKMDTDFPDFIEDKGNLIENNEIIPILTQTWPIILLAKRYIAILSGKPFVINDTNIIASKFLDQSDFFTIQCLPNPNNVTYSTLVTKMIEYSFSINSKIYLANYKPPSNQFYELIEQNSSYIPEIEDLMYEWQKHVFVEGFEPNDYSGIKKAILGNCTGEEKSGLFNYYFIHFFNILLYWPTILCYKYPLPKDYKHFINIYSSAIELFNLIKHWDSIHVEYHLIPNPKELPFSVRTILMTALVFLNHLYFNQYGPLAVATVTKRKIIYLEDFLNRYHAIFEEYASVMDDLNEAKLQFNFDKIDLN